MVKVPLDYRRGEPPKLEENVTNLIGQISLTTISNFTVIQSLKLEIQVSS